MKPKSIYFKHNDEAKYYRTCFCHYIFSYRHIKMECHTNNRLYFLSSCRCWVFTIIRLLQSKEEKIIYADKKEDSVTSHYGTNVNSGNSFIL